MRSILAVELILLALTALFVEKGALEYICVFDRMERTTIYYLTPPATMQRILSYVIFGTSQAKVDLRRD